MQIKQSIAVLVFNALGFKSAGNWPLEKFNNKLPKFGQEVSDVQIDAIEDKATKKVAAAMLKAAQAEEELEVVADEADEAPKSKKAPKKVAAPVKDETPEADEEDDEDEKPAKKSKKAAAQEEDEEDEDEAPKAKSKKAAPAKKAVSAEQDKWGYRVGTSASAIMSAISSKWQSYEDIAKAADCKVTRVRPHVSKLAKEGVVEVSKEGVRFAKGKK